MFEMWTEARMHGIALDPDPVAMETEPSGRPSALLWRSRRYRVSDSPTPLEDALSGLLTHPLPVHGWRFQGTANDGDALVFDVLACADGWRVVHTYR